MQAKYLIRNLFEPYSKDSQTALGEGNIESGKVTNHVHDGAAFNYQALLVSNPNFTIILMTNNKQNNLDEISESIQSIIKEKQQFQQYFCSNYLYPECKIEQFFHRSLLERCL